MKWILWIGGGVVLLAALAAGVGAMLPLRHHGTRKARYRASPGAVYAVLAGPPDWRTGVQSFGVLPERDGRRQWWEEDTHRQKITYELVEAVPSERLVVRIAGQGLPFGGAWTFRIAPLPNGGSELRIDEDGEIYNVLFRFMARFIFGYTASIEGYLRDLGAKFGEAVSIEPLNMGQELACSLRYQGQSFAGKAWLETDFLLFRGETRLRVAFRDLTRVEASGGILTLAFGDSEAALELGTAAAKWANKILHPPSRLDKLGVKPGSSVALIGAFDEDFAAELLAREASLIEGRGAADLLFFAAETKPDLARIPKLIARLTPRGALWVVYPKGVAAIREVEVIQAGRAAGLKDTKVASFSATRTALRFSQPAAR